MITVSGAGVRKPGNYLVPFGTPLSFLLKQVGVTPDAAQVFFGGPMTGTAVENLDAPVTKDVSGILVLTADAVRRLNNRTVSAREK